MALVVTDLGELELLRKMLKDTSDSEQYYLKLYKNNYVPVNSSVLGDFTEANFTNYVQKTIARTDWSEPTTNASGSGESSVSVQSWTCGASGNTVYGYYVVGETSNIVLWAEKFDSARTLVNSSILNITPVFTTSSEN